LVTLLAWATHYAAILALGYLILGVRGLLLALVLREALTLTAGLLRRFI
jgi:hypothetical protein